MAYTFAPHAHGIATAPNIAGQPEHRLFALVDGARATARIQRGLRPLLQLPREHVFEDSFAKSALHLSPVLMQLSDAQDSRLAQMVALDEACSHLPMLTFIRSALGLTALTAKLRELLLVEAEQSPYLLRFADPQMLAAANAVFTPAQRAAFFGGIEGWFTVDFRGAMSNAADPALCPQAVPASPLPMAFDAEQTSALLTAVAVPVLASQIGNLDGSFAATLTHAEQTAFAAQCVEAAGLGATDDAELVSMGLQRWRLASARVEVAT